MGKETIRWYIKILVSAIPIISFVLYIVVSNIERDIIMDKKSKFKRDFTTKKLKLNQLELLSFTKDLLMLIVIIGVLYPIVKRLYEVEFILT